MLYKRFRALTAIFAANILLVSALQAQRVQYDDSWGPGGLSIEESGNGRIELLFSVTSFDLSTRGSGNSEYVEIGFPGSFLYNQPGAPNLPVISTYIAVPEGAVPKFSLNSFRKETIPGLSVAPSPEIPTDTEYQDPQLREDPSIYNSDEFYPAEPVFISEKKKIRGVEVVMLTITPFQYNPVSKELVVLRDIEMTLELGGGQGTYGEERLRSRWWDAILSGILVNYDQVPKIEYKKTATTQNGRTFSGCEYLIISPNGAEFQQWADTLKQFRTEQGILTHVVTLSEIGGNTSADIETYIDNAYSTWDIPPSAILMLGDHGTDPMNSVPAKTLNDHPAGYNPYVTDNHYADVDGDLLPDIAIARIVARDAAELEMMINKGIDYESNPPSSPDFYDHPVTALGWQTERWFQICSESIGGFWTNVLGKNPVRINEIYGGDPSIDPWSTAPNTDMVLDYFGPDGLGYIPADPSTLGGWSGGTAADINSAINSGAFMVQHRDHGYTFGWGEPAYSTTNVSGLNNTDLSFIVSINCQTGRFDYGSECLAEKFHRRNSNGTGMGALGVIAPTETSFSFVNDTYVWGFYDYLWPDFMPDYSSQLVQRDMMPCFANASAKYFLEQSNWPYNTSSKAITYNLFHHHGDAFLTLYSEVPQPLTVSHDANIISSLPSFTVTAEEGAYVALTVDGTIIGAEESTGLPLIFDVEQLITAGQTAVVTVTKRNYLRYRAELPVVAPQGPYVIFDSLTIHDDYGDNDGVLDYGETVSADLSVSNIGTSNGEDIWVSIHPIDPYCSLGDSTEYFGTVPAGGTLQVPLSYEFTLSTQTPFQHDIMLEITAWNNSESWTSYTTIPSHAPLGVIRNYFIADSSGNNNGKLDPGETAFLKIRMANDGSSDILNPLFSISTINPNVDILNPFVSIPSLQAGDSVICTYQLTALPGLNHGDSLQFDLMINADLGFAMATHLDIMIGKVPILVIDLDPSANSGPVIRQAVEQNGLVAEYATSFPASLDDYVSVFVCLGVYPYNTQLTSAQGQTLAAFLNAGGKLYMEGADTWYYDPQTDVHPMFYVQPVSDGGSDLGTIMGVSGTPMDGISVAYSGENQWIDRITAAGNSEVVLLNQSPEYGTTVFNDTLGYQTIAVSHEFAGLADTSNAHIRIMAEYLKFFGIPLKVDWLGLTSDWNDPQNWSNNIIPDEMTHVTIPYSPTRGGGYPTDNTGNDSHCKSLRIEQGALFNLPAGKILYIHN